MAEDFYPFVENAATAGGDSLVPRHPARIAVYDDASAAPRVVVVEPKDVRAYLEEITLQVSQLAQGQGGSIPFMVIREIVENLIHAYFMEPTVSILDHGNTIRFSDQGPGISQKERAMQYGTTSATEEMRRYIRGVGSGLPYVKQYMADKGGSLRIEDNMSGGTVVTISAAPSQAPAQPAAPAGWQGQQEQTYAGAQQQGWSAQQLPSTMPSQPVWNPYQQGYPQQGQPWQQVPQGYPQQALPQQPACQQQPWQQPMAQGSYAQPWQQASPAQQPQQPYGPSQQTTGPQQQLTQPPDQQQATPFPWISVSERGEQAMDYLRAHDAVGPSDLARSLGGSQPTWTRELQALEDQGLVRKDGQKRRLTSMGQAYLANS